MINEITKKKTPIWKTVLNMVAFAIVLSIFVFSMIMNISPTLPSKITGGNITVMDSNAMGREVRKGALVAYKDFKSIEDIKVGDVVVYNYASGGEVKEEIRFVKSIETALTGEKYLVVKSVLDQVESYRVTPNMMVGTVTKDIPALGFIYEILINQYSMLVYSVILLIIILSPILFAKVDYSKQLARKQAKLMEQEQKREKRKLEKAHKTGEDKLVFYDYRLAAMTDKDKELSEIAKVMDANKPIKRRRPLIISLIILLIAVFSVYGIMLYFEYSNQKIQIVDYQYADIEALPKDSDNYLKSISGNALVEYDDLFINSESIKTGDIIIIKIKENGRVGYAPRFVEHVERGETLSFYTYGLLDEAGKPILDSAIVTSDNVLGIYRSHSNSMGRLYEFIGSNIMFALLCLACIFIILLCVYYKVNNRIVYLKPLKDSAKRLLLNAERTVTVRSVTVTNKHRTFAGIITTFVVIVMLAVTGIALWQTYDCSFVEVDSSLSNAPVGTYALLTNKHTTLKIGDKVLVKDKITTNLQQVNVVASKYIIDISGDYYVLGVTPDTPDFIYSKDGVPMPLTLTRGDIYGKSIFAIERFDKVLDRLGQKDMIVVYVAAPILILLTIIFANFWLYFDRKKRGVVQNILGNTFVEHNKNDLDKRLKKASIYDKLLYCEDYTRIAYNEIKNFVLSYQHTGYKSVKGKEWLYCKDRHILSFDIQDNKLFVYSLLQTQKLQGLFDNVQQLIDYNSDELPVKVEIADISEAQEFTKLFAGSILAMRVVKDKKYFPENYSNAYYDRGVLTLKVLAMEVSNSIE